MSMKSWPMKFALCGVVTLVLLAGCRKTTGTNGPPSTQSPAQGNTEKFAVSFTSDAQSPRQRTAGPSDSASAADEATPAEPASTHSFGRIVGVVKWSGPMPELDSILVNKDTHVCAEHGKHDRPPEQLIVNAASGGIKDAVVHMFGKFEQGKPVRELSYPDTLNQRQCAYEPRVFVVPVGARITMTSDDEVGHNVRMGGAADLNIAISKGGRTSRRFEQAGLVKLGCDIHPWMSGYIHVVKHPYYAVTDADGRFELTDVPAGTHQLRLWHESWWSEDGKLAAPIVSTHSVTVRAGETTTTTFELSDPALAQMAKNSASKAAAKR